MTSSSSSARSSNNKKRCFSGVFAGIRFLILVILFLFLFFVPDSLADVGRLDEIRFKEQIYSSEAEYYQSCLKALGYTDLKGKPLDIDGHFGLKSEQALTKFLAEQGFSYFESQASRLLTDLAKRKSNSQSRSSIFSPENLLISPFAFVYGNPADLDDTSDPFYAMRELQALPNIICTEPGELSYAGKKVADFLKPNTRLFGYVNLGPDNPYDPLPLWRQAGLGNVKEAIDRIADSGWYGVFIDQFGYDFGETRIRQNVIVDYAHSRNLKCLVNAWSPDDAMGAEINPRYNPLGVPSHLGQGDFYLIESFLQSDSVCRGGKAYIEKYLKIRDYQSRLGIQTVVLSYKRQGVSWSDSAEDIQLSYVLAQLLGFKGWWFGGHDRADMNYLNPGIDIGPVLQPLYLKQDNLYLAETEKYLVSYLASDSPKLILTPKKTGEPAITLEFKPF